MIDEANPIRYVHHFRFVSQQSPSFESPPTAIDAVERGGCLMPRTTWAHSWVRLPGTHSRRAHVWVNTVSSSAEGCVLPAPRTFEKRLLLSMTIQGGIFMEKVARNTRPSYRRMTRSISRETQVDRWVGVFCSSSRSHSQPKMLDTKCGVAVVLCASPTLRRGETPTCRYPKVY